jgi:molybdopterin-guanine dinucleotide biosynthesis protein
LAVLVISGSGRGAGKTAVGSALIAALPEYRWIAMKVTPDRHGLPDGLWEETDRHSDKDTGRYLAAGARRSFLVPGSQAAASSIVDSRWFVEALGRAPEADGVLVESGSLSPATVALAGEPTVWLAVLAGRVAEWKSSLWAGMASLDAVVLSAGLKPEKLPPELRQKPAFRLAESNWSTPELVNFVRGALAGR